MVVCVPPLLYREGLDKAVPCLRGVRQGCAMSGLLYVLAIEPLLFMLRNKLKGLTLPQCNNAFYLSAYADDVIVFINDSNDVEMLKEVVNDFKEISSATVNWGKSHALLVGKWEAIMAKRWVKISWCVLRQ